VNFSDILIQETIPILEANFKHPFVTGLADGSLDMAKFRYYMIQDMLYIVDYARAMAWVAPNMTNISDIMRMLDAAKETFETEKILKEQYFNDFDISIDDALNTRPAPTCKAHIDHLFRYTRTGSLAEGLSAILPCSWIYVEIGLHYNSANNLSESNPYKTWMETYSDPAFVEMVDWWFSILNSITQQTNDKELDHLKSIFKDSCRYEWLFWEMSWNLESWQPA
jgi:thiaminase (transcriptional activator TenA)